MAGAAMIGPLCFCPLAAHAIGCGQLNDARATVVASLDDQGAGPLASLVSAVLSEAPLTPELVNALAQVRIALGGKGEIALEDVEPKAPKHTVHVTPSGVTYTLTTVES